MTTERKTATKTKILALYGTNYIEEKMICDVFPT